MEYAGKQQNKTKVSSKAQNFFGKKREPAFFTPLRIQAKLTIAPVDDPYEREADAVADKVMRMSDVDVMQQKYSPGIIQRKCAACEEEEKVQMKGEPMASGGITAPSIVNDVINSGGQPLDTRTKSFMESRFGYDFSDVQIHNDSLAHQSSKEINALGYTNGNHIVFGSGQYQPNSNSGKQLLAHELAHVVQQRPMQSRLIQQKVIDDDEHVTCRFGRPEAVKILNDAEGEAARMADNAALALRQNPISETIRASLWKQFKMDYNKQGIRCRLVPAIAERFEVVADAIRSKGIIYQCTDNTGEPHEGCSKDQAKAITRPTLFGGHDISLCLWFWKQDINKAAVLLHEWVHFMYQYQGTGDELPGGFNTAGCYHAFAIEANGGVATEHEERNCTPNSDTKLPPFNKAAIDKVPCPANGFLNFSALAGISSLRSGDARHLMTEVGLDYLLPLGRMHEWELSLGGRFSHIKPSKPEERAAMAVGARVGLTYLRQPWGLGLQLGAYGEGGAINATDPTGTASTVPYLGGGGTLGVHVPLGDQSSMRIFLDAGYRHGVDTNDTEQLKWFHYGIGIAFQTQ